MTDEQIKALVLGEIAKIAPEIDPLQIDPAGDLRDQVDLDSMDVHNLMIAIYQATGIDIPEVDYPQLRTLERCVAYLSARMAR